LEERLTEQPALDLALAETFEQRRRENSATVKRLQRLLGLTLASLVKLPQSIFYLETDDDSASGGGTKRSEVGA